MFDLGNGVYCFFYVHYIGDIELKSLQNLASLLSLSYYHKPIITGRKHRRINKVSPELASSICKMYNEGFNYKEIAGYFGINKETVGVYVRKMKKNKGVKVSKNGKY